MALEVAVSLAGQLSTVQMALGGQAAIVWEERREETHRAMAQDLAGKIENDVFGRQQSPLGQPWAPLSPLTLALRKKKQHGSKKAGEGPSRRFIRSFQLGSPDNVFDSRVDGYTYGSALRHPAGLVVTGFQQTYRIPRGDDEGARGRVRGYMRAMVGIPAPAPGRHLAHPGRTVLDLTAAWLEDQADIGARAMLTAYVDAYRMALSRAEAEVAGTAAGGLSRRISEVG